MNTIKQVVRISFFIPLIVIVFPVSFLLVHLPDLIFSIIADILKRDEGWSGTITSWRTNTQEDLRNIFSLVTTANSSAISEEQKTE